MAYIFDANLAQKFAVARVLVEVDFSTGGNYNMQVWDPGISLGLTTGYYQAKPDGTRDIQIYPDGAFESQLMVVNESKLKLYSEITGGVSPDNAQTLINNLIENNKYIANKMLYTTGLIKKIEAKGRAIPEDLSIQWFILYNRLVERDKKIKECPYLSVKQTGYESTLNSLYGSYFNELRNRTEVSGAPAVGIAPIIVIAIVVAITAAFSYLIYRAFRQTYSTSETDLKVTDELQTALEKLDPEAKQAVLNDLESQIDGAYAQGISDQKNEGFFANAKNYLLIAGGGFLVWKIANIPQNEIDRVKQNIRG
jgi:hypothetical protein